MNEIIGNPSIFLGTRATNKRGKIIDIIRLLTVKARQAPARRRAQGKSASMLRHRPPFSPVAKKDIVALP
ncbi:hypothetical protein [Methylobacterium persicinum]|uniref:Uncharacterized protein n=1 Tax=Methylobacterium persicinum TaxID=374426 RepID=A0ABU0HL00_9HYPH|nr:hypothetical protein [Methylobacterium persicinum]MDQ0442617.1 hypothetical protein [Methylobacterium persicinum]